MTVEAERRQRVEMLPVETCGGAKGKDWVLPFQVLGQGHCGDGDRRCGSLHTENLDMCLLFLKRLFTGWFLMGSPVDSRSAASHLVGWENAAM